MIIGITEKLRKKYKLEIDSSIVTIKNNINCWHGNYIIWKRKPCIIIMNNFTRYSIILYGLKQNEIKNIDNIFKCQLKMMLNYYNEIDVSIITSYINQLGNVQFSKTSDRSVLGTMNDSLKIMMFEIEDYINQNICNLTELTYRINNYISLALDKNGLPCDPNTAMKDTLKKLYSI